MVQLAGTPNSDSDNVGIVSYPTLIVNSPTSSLVRTVPKRLTISASGIMGSHDPAKSMSCETLSHKDAPQRIRDTHRL